MTFAQTCALRDVQLMEGFNLSTVLQGTSILAGSIAVGHVPTLSVNGQHVTRSVPAKVITDQSILDPPKSESNPEPDLQTLTN